MPASSTASTISAPLEAPSAAMPAPTTPNARATLHAGPDGDEGQADRHQHAAEDRRERGGRAGPTSGPPSGTTAK